MSVEFSPNPPPIPSSYGRSARICWILILATVGYVAVGVNVLPGMRRPAASGAPVSVDDDIQMRMTARMAVGSKQLQAGGAGTDEQLIRKLDELAQSDRQKICAAIVAGEIIGPDAALERLAKIRPTDLSISNDLVTLTEIYISGVDDLEPADTHQLAERYGWYGQLALASGRPPGDPQRDATIAPARRAMLVATMVGAAVVLIGLLSLALFILAIVLVLARVVRMTFAPVMLAQTDSQASPILRPVFLEAFALYIVSFVLFLELGGRFLRHFSWGYYLLALLILPIGLYWPVLRGATARQALAGFGLHRGVHRAGFLIEPVLGIVGYVSLLPVVAIGFALTLWLARMAHVTPSHPIVRQLFGSTRQIVIIYILACAWAPLMEESFFRGALYNHLRGRWNVLISSLVVGTLFALVHPQGWTTIPVLGSIGMVLAWIREWRGSIFGCIAAHALNNGVVITLAVLLLR